MIGTMYVDIGDTMTVRNLKTKEYALIDFTKRGWVNKEANAYKFEGKIFTSATETACKPDQHFTWAGGEPPQNPKTPSDLISMLKMLWIAVSDVLL